MEKNIDKNIETNNQAETTNNFWHGGWGFLVFFIGLIGIMVAISYLVKWLF